MGCRSVFVFVEFSGDFLVDGRVRWWSLSLQCRGWFDNKRGGIGGIVVWWRRISDCCDDRFSGGGVWCRLSSLEYKGCRVVGSCVGISNAIGRCSSGGRSYGTASGASDRGTVGSITEFVGVVSGWASVLRAGDCTPGAGVSFGASGIR